MVKCLLDAAEKYDAKVDYKVDISYYPYALKDDDKIVNIVEEKCKKLGFEVSKAPSGGGSDANVYNNNGISAVNLGNGTELVHTLDERLNIDEFENLTKLVLELMI
jgi:tripeptide aminopeptidase